MNANISFLYDVPKQYYMTFLYEPGSMEVNTRKHKNKVITSELLVITQNKL